MTDYWMRSQDRTFACSAENPEGRRNGGSALECSKLRPLPPDGELVMK